MKPILNHEKILGTASELLGEEFVKNELAADGIDHVVLAVETASGNKVILKTGEGASTDAYALELLAKYGIKAPRLLAQTEYKQDGISYPLVVMTFLPGGSLRKTPDQSVYTKELIRELKKAHQIPSPGLAGYALDVSQRHDLPIKDFLMCNLTGDNTDMDWDAVCRHPAVNAEKIRDAIAQAKVKVSALPEDRPIGFLHTDLNSTNILVADGRIEGIIDWSDAKFGDPLFDFARLRMEIQGFVDQKTLDAYYDELQMTVEEHRLEETYFLLNVLDYINWYVKYGLEKRLLVVLKLLEGLLHV